MNVLDSTSGSLGVRSPEISKSKNVEERTGDKQGPGDWRKGTGEAAGGEKSRVKKSLKLNSIVCPEGAPVVVTVIRQTPK